MLNLDLNTISLLKHQWYLASVTDYTFHAPPPSQQPFKEHLCTCFGPWDHILFWFHTNYELWVLTCMFPWMFQDSLWWASEWCMLKNIYILCTVLLMKSKNIQRKKKKKGVYCVYPAIIRTPCILDLIYQGLWECQCILLVCWLPGYHWPHVVLPGSWLHLHIPALLPHHVVYCQTTSFPYFRI